MKKFSKKTINIVDLILGLILLLSIFGIIKIPNHPFISDMFFLVMYMVWLGIKSKLIKDDNGAAE